MCGGRWTERVCGGMLDNGVWNRTLLSLRARACLTVVRVFQGVGGG